jgi:hypothetical protein
MDEVRVLGHEKKIKNENRGCGITLPHVGQQ